MDFTGGLETYEAIEAGLKDLEIGVLSTSLCLLGGALPSTCPRAHPDPELSVVALFFAPPRLPGTVGVKQTICPLSLSKQCGQAVCTWLEETARL